MIKIKTGQWNGRCGSRFESSFGRSSSKEKWVVTLAQNDWYFYETCMDENFIENSDPCAGWDFVSDWRMDDMIEFKSWIESIELKREIKVVEARAATKRSRL